MNHLSFSGTLVPSYCNGVDSSSKQGSLDPLGLIKWGPREIFVGQKRMDPCLAETLPQHCLRRLPVPLSLPWGLACSYKLLERSQNPAILFASDKFTSKAVILKIWQKGLVADTGEKPEVT